MAHSAVIEFVLLLVCLFGLFLFVDRVNKVSV
jgi:hypothetical protein